MTHPGEQFYPQGVRWDDTIARGTLPDLLSEAAAEFGARPALEFRDRPISYTGLEALVETAAAAFLRAGYGKGHSVALFLGNSCRPFLLMISISRTTAFGLGTIAVDLSGAAHLPVRTRLAIVQYLRPAS